MIFKRAKLLEHFSSNKSHAEIISALYVNGRNALPVALLLLCGAMMQTAAAQQGGQGVSHYDLNFSYTAERARIAKVPHSSFWLSGASAEVGVSLYRSLAVAVEVSGGYATNVEAGVNLGKFALTAGPRYTIDTSHWTRGRSSDLFGQALFGVEHGFDSVFPSALGADNNATSAAIEFGGGLDLTLQNGLSLRLPELAYIHTSLPNNGSNSQSDLRLSAGVSLHFNRTKRSK
jgi:hypothetical protein